jgi:DNA-binding IclR family transcriptional regulator
VIKAVRILDAIAEQPDAMSLNDICRETRLAKSTALALCNALVSTHLLQRSPDRRYSLAHHILYLSRAYLERTEIVGVFDDTCRELAPLPLETLVLSVLDGSDVLYIGRRRGNRPVAVHYEMGLRIPATCTASGKALLAKLSNDEILGLFPKAQGLRVLTDKSIATVEDLLNQMETIRELGYASDDEEVAPGMTCLGVAVPGGNAAVAVSMVKSTYDAERAKTIFEALKELADAISVGMYGTATQSKTR